MSNSASGPTPGYLVWRLSTKVRVAIDRELAPLGLTHAKYALLSSLHGLRQAGETPSQRRLADHTGLEALYVSKLARSLERDGLIERPRDVADSRAVRLALTDEGQAVAERAIGVVQRLIARLFEPLGGPDSERTRVLTAELTALLDVPLTT
ncbi:MarR family winged helix-turn-helix transcriptional regulator [Streptomyces longispororuber]|uniref:MarR family winged helix-turn-helix transcriptional regulator n=1 Tax=Streptomyces longispororuber TaxID=68230 RepID=UPI00210C604C|nr:MarR family transcriptional regulator [Streptomyces longispororuber]MCQ4209392.1 MarR family transcriptional regulator [Streptomyces longispororuber]